ncbi:uncharacterized protein TNCV_4125761 [Trichonephila clavipes]|nr:uncharacterized protein TNCV_4125761 [Trichonephila clavipes]
MVSWGYLWPTLRCRREVGERQFLQSAGDKVSRRHCCRVSAADKGCRVYPLDPRLDAVVLYSGCTPEARKLIAVQLSQTYAQAAKSSTATTTTQTDENITKVTCPPLKLLQPFRSQLYFTQSLQ